MACLMWRVQDAGPLPVTRGPSVRFSPQDPGKDTWKRDGYCPQKQPATRWLLTATGHLSCIASEVSFEFLSVPPHRPHPRGC